MLDELKVFTGNANPRLAKDICAYIGIALGKAELFNFQNSNTFIKILENIRQRDVFIVQPTSAPSNDSIMELLIFIDAAKRASAGRITAVIPYYGYGRTDKKDQPRVPITARLVADLITTSGANRVLTIDLHAGQIQGFFNIPVDELSALGILAGHFQKSLPINNLAVVATDIGISKRARNMAEKLSTPLAIVEKRRLGNQDKTETLNLIGNVRGMHALLFDDEIDTGGSVLSAADMLIDTGGAESVRACVTHPVLSGRAKEKIAENSNLAELVVTDTIQIARGGMRPLADKITILSVAPLLGEAIRRIHEGLSVGELFN